jgi:hypothetical protein
LFWILSSLPLATLLDVITVQNNVEIGSFGYTTAKRDLLMILYCFFVAWNVAQHAHLLDEYIGAHNF